MARSAGDLLPATGKGTGLWLSAAAGRERGVLLVNIEMFKHLNKIYLDGLFVVKITILG